MRFPLLLSIVLLFSLLACNRDAADLTTNGKGARVSSSTLSAPAAAPLAKSQQDVPDYEKRDPLPPRMEDPEPESPKDATLSEMDLGNMEAVRNMGPGRNAGIPGAEATPSTATRPAQTTNRQPTTMSNPTQPQKPVLDYGRPLLMLSKSPCYGGGNCRQFTMTLTADRQLIFKPGRGMKKQGTYTRLLTADAYDELLEALEATEPADLTEVYPTDVDMIPADAQASVLTYADVYGKPKKVEVYSDAPEAVTKLLASMEKWADEDFGWTKQIGQ